MGQTTICLDMVQDANAAAASAELPRDQNRDGVLQFTAGQGCRSAMPSELLTAADRHNRKGRPVGRPFRIVQYGSGTPESAGNGL